MHRSTLYRPWPALALVAALTGACAPGNGPAAPDVGSPAAVDVTLSTTALAFPAGTDETPLDLANHGSADVAWRLSGTDVPWLSVEPSSGTLAPGETEIRVRVDRTGLAKGSYAGTLRLLVGEVEFRVAVQVEQPGTPRAGLSPTALAIGAAEQGGALTLSNDGDAPLEWTLTGPSWARLTPASGTLGEGHQQPVTVAVDRSGLDPGTHQGAIQLASDGGTLRVDVTVEVAAPAELRVSPGAVDLGEDASAAEFEVANRGGVDLHWRATPDGGWLSVSPASGTVGPGASTTVVVSASRIGLSPGGHTGAIHFDSDGGTADVPVDLSIPDPTPAPAPAPPPTTTVALQGRVVDQFGGVGVAGLTVSFDGATAVTDADGRFTVSGTPSSTLRALTISGGPIWRRKTFARSSDGRWLVLPSAFDMNAFDDMAREYDPGTIRWVTNPNVYFDVTPPAGFPNGSELDVWVNEVRSTLESFIAGWTDGRITAGSVTVGTSPPATGTPGWIVVGFSEEDSRYGGSRTVGLTRTYWSAQRAITSARVWLRFSKISGPTNAWVRTAVVGHELGHALGVGHMDGNTASIMTPSISAPDLTTFDHEVGDVIYTRSPGNTKPDTDDARFYRGELSPAAIGPAVGETEWICGPPGQRP